MEIQIKRIATGEVLFTHTCEGNTIRKTVEAAVASGANLCYADLCYADLCSADLCYADLCYADLRDANLCYANLYGANLYGADLCGANLCGADLCGANLYGANLYGAKIGEEKLAGERPVLQIGPIGSRGDTLVAFFTESGIRLSTGCQVHITLDEFLSRLTKEHKDNNHAREYLAAIELIKLHAEIYAPHP